MNLSNISSVSKLAPLLILLKEPENILPVSSGGKIDENTINISAMLNALPVITRVVLIPAAIPRLLAETEFIIAARFGELNSPIPPPIKDKGIMRSINET